jgi:type I restriction enzyme, S subunit
MNSYKLKDLLSIKNGRDHKELSDGDIPIFGSGGIMRYGDKAIYNDESILLPRKGTLSNIQYVSKPFWTVDTIYYSVINKDLANPFYLFNFLKCLDLTSLNSGTGVPSMTFNSYYDLKVKLPDLPTQKSIAKVLSDIDAKIELNNKINRELEAMAKTLYDYWFVQFDFPFDFAQGKPNSEGKPYKSSGGKMVYNAELKREIPEGWEVKKLSSILDCNKWTIRKGDKFRFINYLETSNLFKNEISGYQKIDCTKDVLPSRAQRVVQKNDILYSTVRPNQCHFGIIKAPSENMIASTGFAHLRSKIQDISNDLIYQFLSSEYTINRLQKIADSAVSSYPSVLPMDILELKFILPINLSILGNFSKIFEYINLEIANNHKQNQQLTSLRDWLLPMLMNGQVVSKGSTTVKEAEETLNMAAEPEALYKKAHHE